MKSIIECIQDDDPSYDPLTPALKEAHVNQKLWQAACDRVFYDGYYGPINPSEWKEQDGRKPYTVSEAIDVLKKVLEHVTDYRSDEWEVDADGIKAALVPFWREIYGTRYPS